MQRVILAFSKAPAAQKVSRMLDGSPFEVIGVCHTVSELVRMASEIDDIMVAMSFKLPDGTINDAFYALPPRTPLMGIIKSDQITNIEAQDIFIVPLPVNREQLVQSFEMFAGILYRRKPKRSEDDKEIIKKAKLLLMEKYVMTEEQAHRFIQKRSMDAGARLVDMARFILE